MNPIVILLTLEFQRYRAAGPDKYAANGWQKVGGSSVYVEDGKITKGCPGLKGEAVADLIDEPDESRARREHRQTVAESKGLKGHHLTISETKKLETKRGGEAHSEVKRIAGQYDVKPADVLATLDDAHAMVKEQVAHREKMRQRARKLIGMTAGDISRLENDHKDSSSVPGLDEAGRSLAYEFLEFGNPDDFDEDFGAKMWDLIREGAEQVPAKHSPEVIEQAAQIVASTGGARKRGGGGGNYRPPAKATAAHHEDDDFNFGANDSDSFAKRFEEAFEAYRREHE